MLHFIMNSPFLSIEPLRITKFWSIYLKGTFWHQSWNYKALLLYVYYGKHLKHIQPEVEWSDGLPTFWLVVRCKILMSKCVHFVIISVCVSAAGDFSRQLPRLESQSSKSAAIKYFSLWTQSLTILTNTPAAIVTDWCHLSTLSFLPPLIHASHSLLAPE